MENPADTGPNPVGAIIMPRQFSIKDIRISEHLQHVLIRRIVDGSIFIYPTDTVYGIGCNALIPEAVERIKRIKERINDKPFSVIAPSLQWILDHFKTGREFIKQYLPGKYTLILEKRDEHFLQQACREKTLGVRIPKHYFSSLIRKAGVPFITTSANISGKPPASSLKEIDKGIMEQADFIIDGGKLLGVPSTLIFADGREPTRDKQ